MKFARTEIRLGFVRKVYGILIVQLAFSLAIAWPICAQGPAWADGNNWIMWVSAALMLSTLCAMICFQNMLRRFPTNYLFLFVYTVACSLLCGFVSAYYSWQSVVLAAGITVSIFVMMSIYAWNATQDFTGFGPYLYGALFALIAFSFALSIMGFYGVEVQWAVLLLDLAAVILFTFFIIFDTQLIMGEWGGHDKQFGIDDYCFAALTLYVDIMNLFLHILSIVGDRH